MGCWNETCGITQLPINFGNKVRYFVLIYNDRPADGGGTCYPADIWSPLGLAIQGTYNDYGGIENIVENEDTKMIVKIIKESWIPFTEAYQKVSNIKNMKLSEMLDWIGRGKAKFSKPDRHLGQMMVHEEVYQTMISHDFIEGHHYKQGHWKYRLWSEIISLRFKEWFDGASSRNKLFSHLKDVKSASLPTDLVADIEYLITDLDTSFFFYEGESGFRGLRPYKLKLKELIQKGFSYEDERVQKISKTVLEFYRFNRAMSDARKMWHPQCGKGSQNDELGIHSRLNVAVGKIIQKEENERRKIAEEDGEEYEPQDKIELSAYMIEHNKKEEKYEREGTTD